LSTLESSNYEMFSFVSVLQ